MGTKKGEKVDYAICQDGKIRMLVECKPANSELNINHASQLFRYFSTTDARVAVLTNGVVYKFFSDIDTPNRMDDKPFFTLQLDAVRKHDLRTLESFTKQAFDIEKIVNEAGNLKLQSLVYKELQTEFQTPSEEFIRIVAARVYPGRVTSQVKDNFKTLIVNSVSSLIRDRVNERLNSALTATNPPEEVEEDGAPTEATLTTQEEVDGFNIIRAIASRVVGPERVVMRDAKSYCAVLLDDNNRKTVARLHFNSPTARYLGTFNGKDETREPVGGPIDIYKHEGAILKRIEGLVAQKWERDMRYDEPDVREAYRQGARDAFESVASALNRSEARSVKAWLDALEGWHDGDPPIRHCASSLTSFGPSHQARG